MTHPPTYNNQNKAELYEYTSRFANPNRGRNGELPENNGGTAAIE
jgi:hypothetical protein